MTQKAVWGRWVILALLLLVIVAPAQAQYIAPGFGSTPAGALLNSTRLSADYQVTQADLALYRWMPAQAVCPACFYGMRPIDGSYASMLWDGNRLYRLSSPVKIAITAGMGSLLGYTIFRNKWGLIGGAIAGGVTQLIINHHQALRDAYQRARQQQNGLQSPPQAAPAPEPQSSAPIRQAPEMCDSGDSMVWVINESPDWLEVTGLDPNWLATQPSVKPNNGIVRIRPRGRLCVPVPEGDQRYFVKAWVMDIDPSNASMGAQEGPKDWRDVNIAPGKAWIYRRGGE